MKQIEKQLKEWRDSRNIKMFPITIKEDLLGELEEVKEAVRNLDFNNYVEELADVAIFAFNGIGLLNASYKPMIMSVIPNLNNLKAYINNINIKIPTQMIHLLNVIITICDELVTAKRYDFKKVVSEKILVLQSRKQCPIQKKHWQLHGASGKWKKSLLPEHIKEWHKANYGKCKV